MKSMKIFLIAFAFVFVQNIIAQDVINRTLYFDHDKHSLTSSSEASLLNLLGLLSESRESKIEIVGHTDQQGSPEYNIALSRKRAEEVKYFLVNAGYPTTDVKLQFRGEAVLISNSTDSKSLQANRRVSVVAHKYEYETITEFVNHLRPNNETKSIVNNVKGGEIELKQGTVVTIPADAFCHLDGSALSESKVEMTFKEAFDYTQMLDDRLFTQTSDKILETGGMIHIAASQNGIPVKLKEGNKIELLFPEQESKGGMELFTGLADDNGVIWEETGEEITEKKEDYFLQVDFSPITDFKFEYADTIAFPENRMDKYPIVPRKPYPPSKTRYTTEEYAEVYRKYEERLDGYNQLLAERPAKLEAWNQEVFRRVGLLKNHKNIHIASYVKKWVSYQIEKTAEKTETISHHKLLKGFESFLTKKVGDANYDYLRQRNKMFEGSLEDVLDHHDILSYDYSQKMIADYCSGIQQAIYDVKQQILVKKMEMGIVDMNVSRYLVSTSSLGWINCDRFFQLDESEKMNFQFARPSNNYEYYIVFKNIKSMIRPTYASGKVKFIGLPIGEDVRIVGVGVKDNEFNMALQDIKLSKDAKLNLDFSNAKLQDVRNALENI